MRSSIVATLAVMANISGLICSVSAIVSVFLYIGDKDPKIWIPISSLISTVVFVLVMVMGLRWKRK